MKGKQVGGRQTCSHVMGDIRTKFRFVVGAVCQLGGGGVVSRADEGGRVGG